MIDWLSQRADISRREAETFVKAFAQTLIESVNDSASVKVKGLGIFKTTTVAARRSIDVNTGGRITIPSYAKLTLTADPSIAERLSPVPVLPVVPVAPVEPSEVSELSENSAPEEPAAPVEPSEDSAPEEPVALVETSEVSELSENSAPEEPVAPVEPSEVSEFSENSAPEEPAAPVELSEVSEPSENSAPEEPVAPVETSEVSELSENSESVEPAAPHTTRKLSLWLVAAVCLVLVVVVALCLPDKSEPIKPVTDEIKNVAPPRYIAPEAVPVASPKPRVHVLQPGETLTTISEKYYNTKDSMHAIWRLNKFADPNNIPLGTEILLP